MFMDFKFSKNSGDSQQESPGEKKKQSTLLVLLLILVGGFTYLYFFTGLIKPHEVQKSAEAPASESQVVKMPLPPREVEPAKQTGTAPEKEEIPKTAATAPVTAAVTAAKPAAAPVKQASAPAVKSAPAPTPAKLKEEPQKAEAAKPAAAAKKPAVAGIKSAAVKDNTKKPGSGDQTVVKAKKGATDSWMLLIGNYVLEEALSADMGRVRKAGFKPIVKTSARKNKSMNRLFLSDFSDRASAQSTLERLKRYTSDAFIIEQGGRFSVYAGSYLQSESANSEKERLKAAGFVTTIKHSNIAIPSRSLSIGPFNSKKNADAALGRLKSAGIKATFAQK